MFMRFRGGGVGHRATRKHTETMSQEADTAIPDENEDNFKDDETGNSEQLEDELESSSESDIGEDHDEETRKDFGEPEDECWNIRTSRFTTHDHSCDHSRTLSMFHSHYFTSVVYYLH